MRFNSSRRLPLALALGLIAALLVAGSAFAAKISNADQGGRPLSATLTGAAEVPGPGDPDGLGTALVTLNHGQGIICWDLTYENIGAPTMAHIHPGSADESNPPIVWFGGPPIPGVENFEDTGCVEADRGLIKDIAKNPETYYVNIHNIEFGPGAIRGQLSK